MSDAIRAIESEMRRVGMWDVPSVSEAETASAGPFGTRSMSFVRWLRWVFVPRVDGMLSTGAPLPRTSQVAAQAAREWGHSPSSFDTTGLEDLLARFDALFD